VPDGVAGTVPVDVEDPVSGVRPGVAAAARLMLAMMILGCRTVSSSVLTATVY
jgi:hypothetical protein